MVLALIPAAGAVERLYMVIDVRLVLLAVGVALSLLFFGWFFQAFKPNPERYLQELGRENDSGWDRERRRRYGRHQHRHKHRQQLPEIASDRKQHLIIC